MERGRKIMSVKTKHPPKLVTAANHLATHLIKVNQPQPPHARAQQVVRRVRPDAAQPDDDDQGVGQGGLPVPPQELDVAGQLLADDGVGVQGGGGE